MATFKKACFGSSLYIFIIAGAIFTLMPFIWMISTSLKSPNEVFSLPIQWIPNELRFDNYTRAISAYPFAGFFSNSFLVSAGIIVGQLTTSILAAYAFARMEFRGRNFLFGLLLAGMMIPEQTIMIPVIQLLGKLGWMNSFLGLIIPFTWSALIVFLFRQYFAGLPVEVEEAAKMDGLRTIGIIFFIVLPMSRGIISTAVILIFTYAWNQYLWPLLITNKESYYTVQLGLSYFKEENAIQMDWTALMAGTTLSIMPMITIFIIFQKQIINSIAFSGSKE
ncbi:carbohydrate ABC transporter membrane protein 2, CUT1 family [Paenibacillus sp. yr247]|uniref:carbohydrate ABC transporter permease n=1 Tax=Paenibacillus sp. yr247 TaxID=1761880 RepID=UPI000888A4E5|nr:carbohydrate ABC transporter permease [Paenibacillus sp. yr247]SDM79860.1 carbohydrate ABC transporter membrane protein 2, CUT1 family [Paenibacillus sp. yr247]